MVGTEVLMTDSFFKVGDRVRLHRSDGDMHVYSKEVGGEVEFIHDPEEIEVRWDDGELTTESENDLVLE
jgi:hypothetical protein